MIFPKNSRFCQVDLVFIAEKRPKIKPYLLQWSPDSSEFTIWLVFIWWLIGFLSSSPSAPCHQWKRSAPSVAINWYWFTSCLLLMYSSKYHQILIQAIMTMANAMPQINAKGRHIRHLDKAFSLIMVVNLALLGPLWFQCCFVSMLLTFDRIWINLWIIYY